MASLETPTPVSATDTKLSIADLQTSAGLTDQFDTALLKLCDTTRFSLLASTVAADTDTRFCQHLRRAVNADTAYLCNRTTLDVIATSSADSTRQHCPDTQALHSALTSMINDLWECSAPFYLPDVRVYADEAKFCFNIVPIDDSKLLILANTDHTTELASDYITLAISAIHELFQTNKTKAPSHARCEADVFDTLQAHFQHSSDTVIARRLELFRSVVKVAQIDFANATVNKDAAESNEALTGSLQDKLYQTASLWGEEFCLVADLHFLVEASHAYKALCNSSNLLQFSASRPLELKAHSSSMQHPVYLDQLQQLLETSVIHASRLQFVTLRSDVNNSRAERKPYDEMATLLKGFGIQNSHAASRTELNYHQSQNDSHYNIAEEFDIPGSPPRTKPVTSIKRPTS